MKSNKPNTQIVLTTEAWCAELKRILTEVGGNEPVIRRISVHKSEMPAQMLWWRASGSPAICIGVGSQDAELLPMSLSDLLNRTWGPGDITDQSPPPPSEEWEACSARFANGANVQFFVSREIDAAPLRSNLEMLMEIELPVVIRFGQTQMALRDIARLTPGSVIGFERGVDEPVELLVNGHVVALGMAVTVKGSYGIRISEISSRREQLVTSSLATSEQRI
jgi:flagellar motor switch protein FliN